MQENHVLDQLNPEQKQAVTQIEGPVMVIAGPGTGKTQILASRVAEILVKTDASAQNILCLTYTEAGTIAMRKRLLTMIGHDAHRVAIHTFHGFCNRVIQDNPEHFNYKELDPISDLEKIELITDIAQKLDETHPLKKMKGNIGNLVKSLGQIFDWMKKEDVSASTISQEIAKLKNDIQTDEKYRYKRAHKDFKKGDLKIDLVRKTEKKLNDLSAAAELSKTFAQKMLAMNRYDYADMILWVIDLFQNDANVLADYQEQFQFILVDEFQDTSGAQNSVLQLLINYWEKPNVFVVGDDDQSIYRFQGAEVKNVLDFADQHKQHLKSILLKQNYRSTQHILEAAKNVIENNSGRLVQLMAGLDKTLVSASGLDGHKPKIVALDNPFMEAMWVVEDIKKKLSNGYKATDFAIIYAKHAHGELVAKLLNHGGIPVYLKRSRDAFESETVKRLIQLIKYINKEIKHPFSADFELFEILHFPYFNIPSIQLARLSYFINKNRHLHPSWRSLLAAIESISLDEIHLTSADIKKFVEASKALEEMLTYATHHSAQMTVRKVFGGLHLNETSFKEKEFPFELESMVTFIHFVEGECIKNNNTTINDILIKLDLMKKHRIALSKESVLFDKSGVNLMTAHSSKGLEFRDVYLIHCVEKAWEKRRSPGSPFGVNSVFGSDEKSAKEEELRRLFYVAMTRAEEHLTLTYFTEDTSEKEQSRTMFLDEVMATPVAEHHEEQLPSSLGLTALSKLYIKPPMHEFDLLDPPFLSAYLENYKLSVSHLNSYIECPTRFYFQNILRVPSEKNVYMSFGIAIHNALDHIVKILNSKPEEFSAKTLQDLYAFYLKREQSVFTDIEYKDFTTLGKSVLDLYFEAKADNWKEINKIETEVYFDRIEVNGIPIKGQLDKLEHMGKSVNVVDYKTGDAEKGSKKLSPPHIDATENDTINKRFGGPYWRQIMFYSLLVNNDHGRDYKMISGEMDFVEPSEAGAFISKKVFIEDENTSQIEKIIEGVYGKIKNKEFVNGCMKPECHWCNFVSDTYRK